MDRRTFLNVLGLLTGSTAVSACSSEQGRSPLISALIPPDDGVIPGQSTWLFTTCTECPSGCGMQVRLREGVPVKSEGVADHPVSGGGLCMRGQASLWRLYHPGRLKGPMLRDNGRFRAISWDDALHRVVAALGKAAQEGRRSAWLSGRTTGSLSDLIEETARALGIDRLPEFEPFSHAALRRANGLLFGRRELAHVELGKADALLTVGADLLETFVNPVGFARQLSDRSGARWWHAEPHFSLTGANADVRLTVRPGSEPHLLAWLLGRLGPGARRPLPARVAGAIPEVSLAAAAAATGLARAQLEELAAGLGRARDPLVLAGGLGTAGEGGPDVAALAALLQWTLGAVGSMVDFSRGENFANVGTLLDLRLLAERLDRAEIGVLFVARANPVHHAPAAWRLAERLGRASLRVGLGDVMDETLAEMELVLPVTHALESWGEVQPRRGVRGLLRPAIRPLGDTRSEGDLLLELRRRRGVAAEGSYQERLFAEWSARYDEPTLRTFKERGVLEEPVKGAPVSLNVEGAAAFLRDLALKPIPAPPVLVLTPSIRRYDGRSRPLQLLDEIPDPLTTVTYGPWISVSPSDATRLGVADQDELRVSIDGWTASLPVRVQPGLPGGVFAVQRDVLASFPGGVEPRAGEAICTISGARIERTGRRRPLPFLSGSSSQHGRGLIPEPGHRPEAARRVSLYPEHAHPEHQWGMAIDVSRCIGCGACAAACYVENNVPVTGAVDHLRGREMSWLRIEPFYDARGEVEFLPMLCQHCHYAPCETVCPVYAAYHSPEGLNVQVYNRCIGTRYCSHNCPYKVRRFNWWPHARPKPLDQLRNPDLSVRTQGMMEKCTFCVQRIRAAKDQAKDEGRPVRDGDVVTACEQSCPTTAIVFGDMKDPTSRVVALAATGGAWRVFAELGTEPSVHYLRSAGGGQED